MPYIIAVTKISIVPARRSFKMMARSFDDSQCINKRNSVLPFISLVARPRSTQPFPPTQSECNIFQIRELQGCGYKVCLAESGSIPMYNPADFKEIPRAYESKTAKNAVSLTAANFIVERHIYIWIVSIAL